jgi:hypothetical protein
MTTRELDICDDCSMIASDNGIGVVREWEYEDLDEFDKDEANAWQAKVEFMINVGGTIEYHPCSAQNEPNLNIQCDCGCRTI